MAERPLERSEAIVAREELAVGSAMKIRFYPFVPAEAQGTRIRDADGNEYVDMIAAAGVVQTGYRHPQVRDAIVAELDRTWSNMHCVYPNERTTELAEELCARLPGDFPKKAIFGT
ncbi:MAG: aminotransferase class III-fold pyridoxal phosphate-dependent enzyme, partial [Actinobacteria bacterium]|nr:aminotransferase class III-fold pyridoxal phosphate-dependent enzyme [Actinomycetota bacterium]